VCLINDAVRTKLGMPHGGVGQSILVNRTRLLVVGVVETRLESSMFGSAARGWKSCSRSPRCSGCSRTPASAWWPESRSPQVSEDAQAELRFFLRRSRRVGFGEADTFRVQALQQFIDRFNKVASTITLAATGIVGITLLVGGVGIMNIMLVSVSSALARSGSARPSARGRGRSCCSSSSRR
jgi:putative ABC transport system permease protein